MGEFHCSNIAIMQLFHELKQQFPALPDHVVSQCIAQNSYDREICTRSLRETQESRPSPGAFPPPAPQDTAPSPRRRGNVTPRLICSNNNIYKKQYQQFRANRPISLDIAPVNPSLSINHFQLPSSINSNFSKPIPSSAPPTYQPQSFFNDYQSPTNKIKNNNFQLPIDKKITEYKNDIKFNKTSGFEVNVNVECNSTGNCDYHTVKKNNLSIFKKSDNIKLNKQLNSDSIYNECKTRSYTSVSLTLRPPSSDPQSPIDIRSKGSSLTYSSSSSDPRGFQSRLQISINPGNVGSVAAARIKPTMTNMRPSSLIPVLQGGVQRPSGLPTGNQLSRPMTTMSAPTTPSAPTNNFDAAAASSLPTTPSVPKSVLSPSESKLDLQETKENHQNQFSLNKVSEQQRELVLQQLVRKDRLAKELRAEKVRLETMKKELQSLSEAMKREQRLLDPFNRSISPEIFKKKLESEIYQLQQECKILTSKVDKTTDPRVPLGETNEEFYQGIYTGQTLNFPKIVSSSSSSVPPPLPSLPPAWQIPEQNQENDNNRDGPSWVCRMCTFNNHPLMDSCEQCDMLRFSDHDTGTRSLASNHIPVDDAQPSLSFQTDHFKQSTSRV